MISEVGFLCFSVSSERVSMNFLQRERREGATFATVTAQRGEVMRGQVQ